MKNLWEVLTVNQILYTWALLLEETIIWNIERLVFSGGLSIIHHLTYSFTVKFFSSLDYSESFLLTGMCKTKFLTLRLRPGHRGQSFITSYRLVVGGVSKSMTHYDRSGVGLWPIMMYDNDRRGHLKDLDTMLKIRKKHIKRGRI